MELIKFAILCCACFGVLACVGSPERTGPSPDLRPPVAKIVPRQLETHGHVREDPYYWLNRRGDPDVVTYLEAENAYTEAMTAHTAGLQKSLFEEYKARIKQTDVSVPYKRDDYYYYTRMEEGKDYPIFCRKRGSLEAAEEIMIDANRLAEGHGYFSVRGLEVSSGQDLLAYATDTVGRRIYTIRIKNLTSGELLADEIREVTGNVAWANDNKTLFYSKQDPETLRPFRIYRHVLGTDPADDDLVYEEGDETFRCWVFKTKSKKFLMIVSSQTLSTEYRYLDADDPGGAFRVFQTRRREHEYSVDHYGDHFYISTNHGAKNFRLMKTPVTRTSMENWEEVVPHRDDVFLEEFEIFRDFLVLTERREGLIHLRIMPWSGDGEHYLDFGEPAYLAYAIHNHDFDTRVLRYSYTSMTTPRSVYDYDMKTREKTLLKREEILGGFDVANYRTERILVTARDGAKVPVSLVYRKDRFERNGTSPLILYGYGSYGASMDATFDPFRVSLLDRGFVYAIAHVRGGQELGRPWYEAGRQLEKKNTFTDFIDCAEDLLEKRYADPDRIFARGGSAGGLLVGAVVNMRPDLFTGVVADVPFVDVLTTMLDDDIPLTTAEYDEWGDPNEKEYYDYILSYSPYDQVKAADYPNMLVTTSLQDSQVQYWEPAKWVAKLRATKTDDHRLLLKTEMEAGHGGASGRDRRYEEVAFRQAFYLDLAGIAR